MQRARCYLLGETAVVLELEPPVTLESQQRIWGLAQRLSHHEEVVDAIPGMNNITVVLRRPQEMAWAALVGGESCAGAGVEVINHPGRVRRRGRAGSRGGGATQRPE